MRIVKENIEFKRGMTPKESLEIGIGRKIDDIDNPKEGYYLAYRSESKYKDHPWKRDERPDNVFCILEAKRNHADNLLIYRISNWSIKEEGPFYSLQSYSDIKPPSDYVDWLKPIYHIRISKWDEFKDFELKRDGKKEIYGSTLIMGDIKLYENLDFKRGIDPKESLKLGRKRLENILYDNMIKQIKDWNIQHVKPEVVRIWAKSRSRVFPPLFRDINFDNPNTAEYGIIWNNFFKWFDSKPQSWFDKRDYLFIHKL